MAFVGNNHPINATFSPGLGLLDILELLLVLGLRDVFPPRLLHRVAWGIPWVEQQVKDNCSRHVPVVRVGASVGLGLFNCFHKKRPKHLGLVAPGAQPVEELLGFEQLVFFLGTQSVDSEEAPMDNAR